MFAIIGKTPGGSGLSSRMKVLAVRETKTEADETAEASRKETKEFAEQLPAWAASSGVYSHITVQEVQ